jgi:ABC-type dipeptide/oligopeptide/nickel transport system permease component
VIDEAIAIVVVIGVVFANPIAGFLYAAVNPRIRYKV